MNMSFMAFHKGSYPRKWMILRFYRMYFTSCLNIVKKKKKSTHGQMDHCDWLTYCKESCFNIFMHIFSRNTREPNISKTKRYSKTGRTIGSSRGFRRIRCDHEGGVTGKQLSLVHTDMFAWGYVTCQRVSPRSTRGKDNALGRGDLERVLLCLSDGSATWLGVPASKTSKGQQ